jgi:hypothetical protein
MAEPKHIKNYHANEREVLRLLEIHEQLTGTGPGRRHEVQVLHKSAIVLLTAAWEAFVEDLAEGALRFMINNARDHTVFPQPVLERVASSHNGIKAWNLAGQGWKQALRDHLKHVLARTTGTLNTPKTAQVDELFEKTIGMVGLSATWRWKGSTPAKAASKLDDMVTLRGSIAHRVLAARDVGKAEVRQAAWFVLRIGSASSNAIRQHVRSRTGKYPWTEYFPEINGS